jgi:hypothetical protein
VKTRICVWLIVDTTDDVTVDQAAESFALFADGVRLSGGDDAVIKERIDCGGDAEDFSVSFETWAVDEDQEGIVEKGGTP